MKIGPLTTLGQELHFEEAVLAARLAAKHDTRADLTKALVEQLPQTSPTTRLRIAEKLIQRLVPIRQGRVQAAPLVRLIAETKDQQSARDMVFYLTARTDHIVAALACRVLHPALVEHSPPKGLSPQQFRIMNTAALFDVDAVLTRRFVIEYAARAWDYHSRASVLRALRIMRQAGLVDQVIVSERPATIGFALAPHSVTVSAFALLLHEELPARHRGGFAPHHIHELSVARLFLLPALHLSALLEKARAAGLLRRVRSGTRPLFALTHPTEDQAVSSLLSSIPSGRSRSP